MATESYGLSSQDVHDIAYANTLIELGPRFTAQDVDDRKPYVLALLAAADKAGFKVVRRGH